MAQNEPNILPHLSTNFVTVGEKSTVGAPLVTPSLVTPSLPPKNHEIVEAN